jgi:putative peptidoglycan lipid II flippase
MSGYAAQQDTAGLRATISNGLRLMLMLNVPATVGLVALAHPIVAVIFEHGAFTPADTTATAAALIYYAPGLVGYSAVKLASPAFYALRDSRTPVTVSVLSVAANVALNLSLVGVMGYRGLALGTALSALLNATVLLFQLRRRIGSLDDGRVAMAFVKISIASAVMAIAVRAMSSWLDATWPSTQLVTQVLQLGGSIVVGLLVLGVAARALRIAELDEAVGRIRSRLPAFRR